MQSGLCASQFLNKHETSTDPSGSVDGESGDEIQIAEVNSNLSPRSYAVNN